MATDIEIDKVQLTPEIIDDFRLNFGAEASDRLAEDLVNTFSYDYASQIENDPNFFTFDLLKSGKATFFDQLSPKYTMEVNGEQKPIRDMLAAERAVRFQNPDAISALLSNASMGSLPRAFFGEFFKSAPSVAAGTRAAQKAAAVAFRTPPKTIPGFLLRASAPLAAFLGGSYLLYEGVDALEEGLFGPDEVILPSQKPIIEAVKTAGGGAAGIQFPFLMRKATNRAARDLLANLAEDAPASTATKLTAALENLIEGMAKTSKGSKRGALLTGLGETIAGAGSTTGAYYAEQWSPGSTGARLGAEFLGGNTFAATFGRLLPKLSDKLVEAKDSANEFLTNMASGKQQKLFKRMNELYELHGGNYEAMMNDLNNEETRKILSEVFPGVEFTAGQRLSDDTGLIMMVEAGIAKDNPELLAARMKADRDAAAFFDNWIKGLLDEGSQESMRAAALLRKNLFSDALRRRLTNAIEQQVSATQKLFTGVGEYSDSSPQQLSIALANTLDAQLDLARRKEKSLWNGVGNFKVFEPEDILDSDLTPAIISKYDELLKEKGQLPAYRRKFISDHRELHETIQGFKRKLGIDIREGIAEQNAILDNIAQNNFDELMEMNAYVLKTYAPTAKTTSQQIAAQKNLIDQLNNGKLGEKTLTKDEQTIMLAAAKAQAKNLEFELAKKDPNRLEGLSAKELVELRKELRNTAVSFYSGATTKVGSANEARQFGELSDSILDDLDSVEEGSNEAYDLARSYSGALNDTFTRSIVGKARAQDAMGGNRLPPELLNQTYIRGNPDVVLLRAQQLQGVAKFAHEQGLEGATETFTTIQNIMESAIRDARKASVYPVGHSQEGQVNANQLASWKRDNAELLETFPNLKRDLENAISAQRTFEVAARRSKEGKRLLDSQVYLSTVLNNTSPTAAIAEALNFIPKGGRVKNPAQGLSRLFRLSRLPFRDAKGKLLPEAEQAAMRAQVKEGFENAILQYAFMKAGGEGQTFDPVTFHRTLFSSLQGEGVKPVGGGDQSLVEVAKRYGAVDEKLFTRIRTISNQMVRLAAADAAGRLDDPDLVKEAGPILDFYIGMVGLAGGTRAYEALMGGRSGTGAISAAAEGKREILRIFRDLPASQRLNVFQLVFKDPQTTASLLRAPKNEKELVRQLSTFKQFLVEKGFASAGAQSPYIIREMYEEGDRGTGATLEEMTGTEIKEQEVEAEPQASIQRTPALPTRSAAAPETRPFVVAQAPTSDSSGVASLLPQGKPDPNVRRQYGQLFPYDIVST